MEFFNVEMPGNLMAKRTVTELLRAADEAEKQGKYNKAARLVGRATRRGYKSLCLIFAK